MAITDDDPRPAASIARWAVVLGAVGLVSGFFGPMVLSPDSNQGPMLGLFIAGPAGALLGAVLATLARLLPISGAANRRGLAGLAVLLAAITLYFCLPEPEAKGVLIEGRVTNCQAPPELVQTAIADWDKAIAAAPWGKPRPGWREGAPRMLQDATGVVLTVDVTRENRVLEHRKPWDAGRLSAGGWQPGGGSRRYFADYAGAGCAAYAGDLPPVYVRYGRGSAAWPPDDPAGFLGLARLEPEPAAVGGLAVRP
jgi:hypothetical protein